MRLKSFQSLSGKITNWVFFIGLPLLLAVVLLMFYFSWRTDQRIEEIAAKTKAISTTVQDLSEDNKNLSLENRQLAKDNRAYNLCTAKLFAKYTRDNQPISIKNLKKCTIETLGEDEPNSSVNRGSSDSGSKSLTKPKQPNKPNDPEEPEPPTLLDEIIETINNASSNVLDDVLGD